PPAALDETAQLLRNYRLGRDGSGLWLASLDRRDSPDRAIRTWRPPCIKLPSTRKTGCTKVQTSSDRCKWVQPFPRVRARLAPRMPSYRRRPRKSNPTRTVKTVIRDLTQGSDGTVAID